MRTASLFVAGLCAWLFAASAAPLGAAPDWCAKVTPAPSGPAPGAAGPKGPVVGGAPATAPPNAPMAPETAPLLPPVVRGPSTRTLLTLDWSYPVHAPAEVALAEGATTAKAVRKALTYEQAFAEIAGEDPRPLLVLRECAVCNGTDDALLSRSVDNERTFLMARWFHCVKLPVDVLADDHPFRSLFPGGRSEHLFLATRDGTQRIALEGERSRAELWTAMSSVLASDYADDPERVVKGVQRKLDRLDAADQRLGELQSRYDQLLESEAGTPAKLKKARAKLAEARAERDALLDEVKAAGSELELRHPSPSEPARAESP